MSVGQDEYTEGELNTIKQLRNVLQTASESGLEGHIGLLDDGEEFKIIEAQLKQLVESNAQQLY